MMMMMIKISMAINHKVKNYLFALLVDKRCTVAIINILWLQQTIKFDNIILII